MASYAGFFAILPVISDSARSKLDEIDTERIASFLGRKAQHALSAKVRPKRLIAARAELEAKIAKLAPEHTECSGPVARV